MRKKTFLWLSIIVIVGSLLRLVDLASNPPALYGDELTAAFDTYSIITTGKDQLGNFLPLTFPLSDGRGGGYIYLSAPFVALFGPSALGVRLLSALSGTFLVVLVFFIGKALFNTRVGLFSSALMAVSPWGINISRGGFEANLALFLFSLGFCLFLYARSLVGFILSALFFGVTLFTYHSFKVITIVFLPVLLLYSGYLGHGEFRKSKKNVICFLSVFGLFVLLWLTQISRGSEARLTGQNIFSSSELSDMISQTVARDVGFSKLNGYIARVFSNKFIEYGKVLVDNYASNFSPSFLFTRGDLNPRHNMSASGQFLLSGALLLLVSFWAFSKYKKSFTLLGVLVVVAALPGAIISSAHALRSVAMLVPLVVLSGVGASVLFENFKRSRLVQICSLVLVIFFCVQFLLVVNNIFFISGSKFKGFWAYGAREASELAISNIDRKDYVWLSDSIDGIFLAFPVYSKVSAVEVIRQNSEQETVEGVKVKKYGNVYIGSIKDGIKAGVFEKLGKNYLIVANWDEGAVLEQLDGSKSGMFILKQF